MEETSTAGRTSRARFAGYACLVVIPLCVVVLIFWTKALRGPCWLATNHDPSYHYLLNSLMVAELQAPYHVDNPGTPLQVLGAVVIWVTHLFRGATSTRLDVLENPELYLGAIHATVTCLYGVALLLVGFLTLRTTRSVVIAVAMQSPPLLAHRTLFLADRVMPEPVLMGVAALFCTAALAYLWQGSDGGDRKRDLVFAIVFGALIGVGVAAKLTFAPLALAPLVLLPRVRPRLLYVLTAPLAFVVATLPALANYPRLVAWYTRWATHTGTYGGGEAGLFKPGHLHAVMPVLARTRLLPLFLVCAVAAIVWLWRRKRAGSLPGHFRRVQRGLLAFVIVAAATALMLLKQPRYHYVVPLLSCLGLGAVLCFEATKLWPANLRPLRIALVLVLVGYVALTRALDVNGWRTGLPATTQQYLAAHDEMSTRYAGAAKVYFFRASSEAYAFSVSSYRSGDYFAEDLRRLYPRSYLYNLWSKQYTHFGKPVTLEEIAAQSADVVFQGERLDRDWHPGLPVAPPNGAVLEVVFPGKREAIYKLKEISPDPSAPGIVLEDTEP